ncbi:MAG: alkaline phosphatase family protein [Clostridia bacterium]|nr:alkaline phosphatase family protein [Clostridia bacterium]
MKNRKLIIVSNDALVKEDMDYLLTKPLIKQMAKKGTWVKTLKTVYPSITYCCHTSMITGCYPNKTHLYNNEVDEWGNSNWVWERSYNKMKTLLDAFKEKGLTTANVFWPVTGKDNSIDYNIPEYWSQTADEPLTVALKRMGTSDKVIKDIVEPNLHYIDGHQRQHPYCDEFVFSCACDMIKKYQPDLLVLHPGGIDGLRHQKGVFNEYVTEQVDITYYWLNKIVQAVKEIGEFENTDFIFTSDHGQMDIKRWAHPNVLSTEAGLITLNEENIKNANGKFIDGNEAVSSYRAYIKAVGASAQVFIKDKDDKEAYDLVHKLFSEKAKTKMYGFERVYTTEEALKETHLSGDFDFVLESDGYSAFGWEPFGPYYTGADISDYRTGVGTHGYLPDKGPQPSMLMFGPDFNEGVTIERRDTIDMVATLVKLFNLNMPDIDGKVIFEAIKNK